MGRYRKIYVVWLCGFYLMTATIYAMLGIGMLYSYIVYGRARILLIGDVYSEHFVEIPVFLLASITSIHQLIKHIKKLTRSQGTAYSD